MKAAVSWTSIAAVSVRPASDGARCVRGRQGAGPDRVGSERRAHRPPVRDEAAEAVLGSFPIRDRIGALGEEERHLGGGQPVGEEVEQRLRGLGWRRALEIGREVREQRVVSEEGLPASGVRRFVGSTEHDRGGREADEAVGHRRLVLDVGGRSGRGSGLGALALVFGHDVRIVGAGRGLADRGLETLRVVEIHRTREVSELERAERLPLGAGHGEAGCDDRATAASGARRALFRLGGERHPVPRSEDLLPAGECPLAVERARRLLAHVLAKADHHEPPRELVAKAPLEDAQGRVGRVRPGAPGVGVQRGLDHGSSIVATGWYPPHRSAALGGESAVP